MPETPPPGEAPSAASSEARPSEDSISSPFDASVIAGPLGELLDTTISINNRLGTVIERLREEPRPANPGASRSPINQGEEINTNRLATIVESVENLPNDINRLQEEIYNANVGIGKVVYKLDEEIKTHTRGQLAVNAHITNVALGLRFDRGEHNETLEAINGLGGRLDEAQRMRERQAASIETAVNTFQAAFGILVVASQCVGGKVRRAVGFVKAVFAWFFAFVSPFPIFLGVGRQ